MNEIAIQRILKDHVGRKWVEAGLGQSSRMFVWAAMLSGEIVFSNGGGNKINSLVGKQLGVDFGDNPEFFQAVQLLRATGERELTFFSEGKEDNLEFVGRRYMNHYTAIYRRKQLTAVFVVSVDITEADSEAGICPLRGSKCPA